MVARGGGAVLAQRPGENALAVGGGECTTGSEPQAQQNVHHVPRDAHVSRQTGAHDLRAVERLSWGQLLFVTAVNVRERRCEESRRQPKDKAW